MTSAIDFQTWCAAQLDGVEAALSRWVPESGPAGLGDAMRYAVLDGGKRLRPLLVLAACEAVDGLAAAGLRAACAVELIHAYSLVHDDLPCMDNDVLRRGKPTVHVAHGEAVALLAGDALQVLAFDLLTPEDSDIPLAMQAVLCRLLARGSGWQGMAGGQAIDLASVGKALSRAELEHMHSLKTGKLLQTSVLMGVACGNASASDLQALSRYGELLGLAFQVVDDILDVTADSATLGKTAGKDAANDKPTYVSLMGIDDAKAFAQQLLREALSALNGSSLTNTERLRALADMVVNRQS